MSNPLPRHANKKVHIADHAQRKRTLRVRNETWKGIAQYQYHIAIGGFDLHLLRPRETFFPLRWFDPRRKAIARLPPIRLVSSAEQIFDFLLVVVNNNGCRTSTARAWWRWLLAEVQLVGVDVVTLE